MHEMSLMAGVFDAVNAALLDYQVTKVTKVKLQVGKFTNAEPASLEFAFQAFAQGTFVEGAELEIEEVPVVAKCNCCGNEFNANQLVFFCPKCENYDIEIISGRELILESLEVE